MKHRLNIDRNFAQRRKDAEKIFKPFPPLRSWRLGARPLRVDPWLKIFILLSNIFLIAGCSDSKNPEEITLSGTLELTEHSLGAHVAGRLTSLLVDEGSEVKKGQLLGSLDRYDQAKRDDDRAHSLFQSGGATQQTLEEAELTLEDQEIVSPVEGVVLVKVSDTGEVLSPGSTVLIVGDRKDLWVRTFVPEGFINRINMGQEALAHFDGFKEPFKGHITFIATKAEFTPRNVQTPEERVTQTFAIKVRLDAPPDYLRPGVSADVTLKLGGSK